MNFETMKTEVQCSKNMQSVAITKDRLHLLEKTEIKTKLLPNKNKKNTGINKMKKLIMPIVKN